MHTHINHTNSLSLCYSDMFPPSKCYLQRVRLIHFQGQINKKCTRREIQFIEQFILYYAAGTCWSNRVLINRVLINWCENYKYA